LAVLFGRFADGRLAERTHTMRWNPLTWFGPAPTPGASPAKTQKPPAFNVTVADGVKTAFTVFVGGFCPFAILVILTISAGFYFNALRGFSADVQSVVAYGTALIVELVNLALFFVSAKSFWAGKTWHFVTALVLGMGLTIISVIAQVLYLTNNLDAVRLQAGATTLEGVPLIGGLASTSLIIITRALALHVAEFACCYVVARSAVSHRKLIQAQQEAQEAELALLEAQQFSEFKKAIHQAQMSQLKRMQAMLESPGSVQIRAVSDHPAPNASTAASRLERLAELAVGSEQVAFAQSQSLADELQPLVALETSHEQGALVNGGGALDGRDPFRRGRDRPTP
jgi:signal transduction histidine kinase